jgi:hypothetical protein
MRNGTVSFLPNTWIVNKGKLVSFVKRGEELTETCQSSSVLVAQPGWGAAKNCVIFPIASFWRLPIVALLKSEHEPVHSNGNHLNALDTLRGQVVLGHGGFCAFRDKTTL